MKRLHRGKEHLPALRSTESAGDDDDDEEGAKNTITIMMKEVVAKVFHSSLSHFLDACR